MRSVATGLVRQLSEAGYQALFAGGCVRDTLLGKSPKDYDIATNATPQQVAQLFPGAQEVGAHFGVIVLHRRGWQFEIATFRQDGTYTDGRRPDSVEFTTAERDAQRRDFTVNGLFYDPLQEQVLDYVGGRADLEVRVLRAIGDPRARFAEDHLRLLRAVRFATVLGFEIEPQTWAAIQEMADSIASVSVERVREELVKTLLHPNRQRGFDLLVDSGLMAVVLPEILRLQGCDQPPQWHPEGDVYTHTRIMLGMLPAEASLSLVLSVLFHDIAKPDTRTVDETGRIRFNGHDHVGALKTEDILRRLKFPNDIITPTVAAVANHMIFKDVTKMRTATLKRFMARPGFDDEMELHRVDCTSSNGLLDNYAFLKAKTQEYTEEQSPLIPEPLVTGRDLIALGWSPGPRFKDLLTAVQTQQLEGALTSREQALAWLAAQVKAAEQAG